MWKLLFPAVSYLLFAAHVLFHGFPLLVLLSIVMLGVLGFWQHRWARLFSMVVLAVMGLEWLRAGWQLVQIRMFYDEPWLRAAAIMVAAALWTWLSAVVFVARFFATEKSVKK